MKRLAPVFCATLACFSALVLPLVARSAAMNVRDPARLQRPPFAGTAKFTALPARNVTPEAALAQSAAGFTLPLWSGTATALGKTFKFIMLGTSPLNNATAQPSIIDTGFINFNLTFADGTQLGTTAPACGDSETVVARTFGSPLFQNANYASNGQYVGFTQFTDAFQRAAFWRTVQNSGYHVLLVPGSDFFNGLTVSVSVPASEGQVVASPNPLGCPLGLIDLRWFDALEQSIVKSIFHRPDRLPITLLYNTFLFQGTTSNCCVLGYHSAFATPTGTQTYSVGAYFDSGIFSNQGNISALSHELGEFFDDPLVDNATPAWGHTGQVSGCQANLEVGDPLSGHTFTVTTSGFNYLVQELAFPSWFFRQAPSTGAGGKDSFHGTFSSGQPTICK